MSVREGTLWEIEMFGVGVPPYKKIPYLTRTDALLEARRNQGKYGWNPQNPSTEVSQELFKLIVEQFPDYKNFRHKLRFYCSLGLALDYFHGIDGFFSVGDTIVTIDLSVNNHKRTGRADVILRRPGSGRGSTLQAQSITIATLLRGKIERRNARLALETQF